MINVKLAKSRGLTLEEAQQIQYLQQTLDDMVLLWEFNKGRESIYSSRRLLKDDIETIEYELQELWGFDPQREKHHHWKRFTGLYRKRGQK